MRLPAAAALALVLLAAGCSREPSSPQSPPPAPLTSPTAATPAAPSGAIPATASPYRFVVTPPAPAPGMPAILEIDLLDQTVHAGAPYSVRVKTSPDVTSVRVSAMGQTYGMQAAGAGLFASDGQVPDGIPFFMLNRSYALTVTAQSADGRTTSVPVTLRLER